MDWKKLLSRKVFGETKKPGDDSADGRSQFQRDFDRIVFSPPFRRLQDKTQVFPLPESDFVHTRLTHSLEVSCVGRSLGNLVGKKILQRNKKLKRDFTQFHFGEIVGAACLAHDIGNPPFGHSGEDAIAQFFKKGNGRLYEEEINDKKKWYDFVKFEGNAQGLRIIAKLQNPDFKGGLRLTYASLASVSKYPKESFIPEESLNRTGKKKLYRKFGFFQAEKNIFKEIAEEVGLEKKVDEKNVYWWCRHPLVFLVEAADDICYRVMDLEDGFRLNLVNFRETEELLMPLVNKRALRGYKERTEKEKIGYLRAKAIGNIVEELAEAFLDEEKNVLDGCLEEDLISIISKSKKLELIKKISIEKIYSHRSVVEREAAGYEVLGGLLDEFTSAVSNAAKGISTGRDKTILKLIPKQYLGKKGIPDSNVYTRLLQITDMVSGMTDSYAVSLYRKIKGISLPER